MKSQQRSDENERKEKQYRRRSRQTKNCKTSARATRDAVTDSISNQLNTPRDCRDNSPELLARVVMHRHTENDKLISNPDKNGSSAIRSCQSQGRIQGFNPQISQSPQRSLTSPDLGSPPTDGGSFHSLLTVNPLSDRRGIFGDKTCRLLGRHRAHTPH
jgi:hypothetical protein